MKWRKIILIVYIYKNSNSFRAFSLLFYGASIFFVNNRDYKIVDLFDGFSMKQTKDNKNGRPPIPKRVIEKEKKSLHVTSKKKTL